MIFGLLLKYPFLISSKVFNFLKNNLEWRVFVMKY